MRWWVVAMAACGGASEPEVTAPNTPQPEPSEPILEFPRPGNSDANCYDTEPNDTPEEAVPCGPVHEDPTLGTGAVYPLDFGHVDEDDPVDWYVFKTAQDTYELHQFAWWPGVDANLVDLVMYESTGVELVEVWRSEETATNGENMSFTPIAVEPSTTYLLEVAYVEGVGDYGL